MLYNILEAKFLEKVIIVVDIVFKIDFIALILTYIQKYDF